MKVSRGRALIARVILAVAVCLAQHQAAQSEPTPMAPLKEIEVGASKFSLGDPVPQWVENISLPGPDRAQPLSLLVADTQYQVAEVPVVYVRRAFFVNDSGALASAGQIPIGFVPDYERLRVHSIRIHRGSEVHDRTHSSMMRFLQRETGLEAGVYSGEVTASILVNDLRVGDTLEYTYSVEGQNPVFGNTFVASAVWDSTVPAARRRVIVNHPATRTINWRFLSDGQGVTPTETVHGEMRRLVFEGQSLSAVSPESLTPSDEFLFRSLQFSEFPSWTQVVNWARELFQIEDVLGDDLNHVVGSLQKRSTPEEQVTAALEFVQSEIRYFSVSLGENSHRPANPNLVLNRRYGDCKDKSIVLIALLRKLGIEARPVLLTIGSKALLSKLLPSPTAFNHVIVQVVLGGQVYHLDPTRLGQHGRLNRMGQAHEATQALLVDATSREPFMITGPEEVELVRSDVSEVATLPKFGEPGTLKIRQTFRGLGAETVRFIHTSLPADRFTKYISEFTERRYQGSTLLGSPHVEDDRLNNVLVVEVQFRVPELAIENDGNWLVPFLPSNMFGALARPPSSDRRTSMALPAFPFEANYEFEVRFPEDVSAVRDPSAHTVESKFFTYTLKSSFRGHVAKASIYLKTLTDRVPVSDLNDYMAKKKTIGEAPTVVMVRKDDIGAATAGSMTFSEKLRARIEDAIAKTTNAIASGKLSGSDLALAYCNRSFSHADLGMFPEAIQDANEALKIDPNSANNLVCRANAYNSAGQFGKSIADYSKAISFGGTDADNYRARGVAKFYLGRLAEAADDFAKAGEVADSERRLYSDLWLSWTLLRLGQPLPENIAARAASEARGPWPRPALALFAGAVSPEEVLVIIEAKAGDEKHMTLAEGYFYIGQYHLAKGDKSKARDFFEKTRKLGVLPYTEHMAAGFELDRIEPLR